MCFLSFLLHSFLLADHHPHNDEEGLQLADIQQSALKTGVADLDGSVLNDYVDVRGSVMGSVYNGNEGSMVDGVKKNKRDSFTAHRTSLSSVTGGKGNKGSVDGSVSNIDTRYVIYWRTMS